MNTPVDEVRRLRDLLAERDRQLRELADLLQKHLQATAEDPEVAVRRQLQREQAAFNRGYQHGDEDGWRRGVEHALIEVDRAHWCGDAHDHHGQMRELGMHNGPVPEPMTADEIVARAERDNQLRAQWWWKQYMREHPEAERELQSHSQKVRQLRPKGREPEREAG